MSDHLGEVPDVIRESLAAYGTSSSGIRTAHADSTGIVRPGGGGIITREAREELLARTLAPGATLPAGAGNRHSPEEADDYRTCFERDLDRIKHSTAFRRLAGKTQVVIAASNIDDMLRNRLTHAVEVAQVALGVARPAGLNPVLTEAIALAHDTGHSPCGHAGEEAFDPYLPGGYDHAVYGADVVLSEHNLTLEVLDGVRNHSWRRPAPSTPEGEVVSWADRIAYVCHDADDAIRSGIISVEHLPEAVAAHAGVRQSSQIRYFVNAMLEAIATTGRVGMTEEAALVLDTFRRFNYDRIYLRPASRSQAERGIKVLQSLVEYFADAPGRLPHVASGRIPFPVSGSPEAAEAAVRYVSGMTDRFALNLAVDLLGWSPEQLPRGA